MTASEMTEQAAKIAAEAPPVEWKHPTLASALVAALADLIVVEKSGTGNYGTYADLADLGKVAKPKLAVHGLTYWQNIHAHEAGLAVTTILLHESGDRETCGPLPFPSGQNAPATGSFITYMRRYALAAALGLAPGDSDDDGAAAVPAPKAWNENQAKAHILTLAEGNKDLAAEAWPALKDTEWTADALVGAWLAWVNTDPTDPGGNS